MSTKSKPPFGAAAAFFALVLGSKQLAAAEAHEKAVQPAELGLSAQLFSTYTTNLYHEQRRREDDFDRNGRGQRYYEMEGPADLVTEAEVSINYGGKVSRKRSARVELAVGYVLHLRNAIANYFRAEAGAFYDVTSRDRLTLGVEGVPRRFKKNYSIREVAGEKYYEHAYFWEIETTPGWRHEWTKHAGTELAYEFGVRRYLDPFGNRDTTRHAGELVATYDFGRVEPSLGGGAALGTTPSGLEFGVPVDRSYRDITLLAGLDIGYGAGFSSGLEVEYRNRHYTTDEPLNETYFDRTDQRWSVVLDARKRFGKPLALLAEVGFVNNATNRQDHPGVAPEDLGYQEWTFGLGIEATL